MLRVAANGGTVRWLWIGVAVGLAALIFYQSSHSSIRLQDRPLNVVFGEQRSGSSEDLEDTAHILAHIGLYGALAFSLHRGLGGQGTGATMAAVGLAGLYGVSDELHQSLGDTRSGSAFDVAFDCIGAILGVAASLVVTAALSVGPSRGPRTSSPD
jgi:VanZ family protein